MEFANIEIAAVREAVAGAGDQVVELNELELALVGGGTGDVQFG